MSKTNRREFLAGAVCLGAAPLLLPSILRAGSTPNIADNSQDSWHYCTKCWTLFWDGSPNKGRCSAGGGHTGQGFNFLLPYGDALPETATGQIAWRFCNKCFELFWDGAANKGRCAASGGHVAQGFKFRIPHDVGNVPNSQTAWRFCSKCWAMFFDGATNKGSCPAGGGHAAQGFNFAIPHTAEFAAVVEEARFQQSFTTRTALGGDVDLTLRSNGTYKVHFRVHDSGLVGYNFQVRALFAAANGLVFALQHSGHIDGGLSDHNTYGDFEGSNRLIKDNWAEIKAGKLIVTKEYATTGIAGFVEDVANIALGLTSSVAHAAVGVVVGLGDAMVGAINSLGPSGAFAIVAGVVVFASGGTLVMALTSGARVGLVTAGLVKQKALNTQEMGFAAQVFGGSLPPGNTIFKTNLHSVKGRAFTIPGVANNMFINLGDGFDNPTTYTNKSYPKAGQLFIHEMTHVWQIHNRSFVPGWVCSGIAAQVENTFGNAYAYGGAGRAWNDFNIEQQGAIVDQWFGGTRLDLQTPKDINDPFYHFIRDNILTGRP